MPTRWLCRKLVHHNIGIKMVLPGSIATSFAGRSLEVAGHWASTKGSCPFCAAPLVAAGEGLAV
ncbi:MAG: hypothetical protein EOO56_02105 [Hymenobacter sp.]|nr:MAG: hypothetical protein EOO56_02105 [Hymenobacter sp.]